MTYESGEYDVEHTNGTLFVEFCDPEIEGYPEGCGPLEEFTDEEFSDFIDQDILDSIESLFERENNL